MCGNHETLCKDKWPPMQPGENLGCIFDIEDKLCPKLTISWENKFTLLEFQIDSRLKKIKKNYSKCFEKMHKISRK